MSRNLFFTFLSFRYISVPVLAAVFPGYISVRLIWEPEVERNERPTAETESPVQWSFPGKHWEQVGPVDYCSRNLCPLDCQYSRSHLPCAGTFSIITHSQLCYPMLELRIHCIYIFFFSCMWPWIRNPSPQCAGQSKLCHPVNHLLFHWKRCISVRKRRCCRSTLWKGRHQSLFSRT